MNNRILIIEDNEQNMYLMRFLLESAGYQIVEARDGKSGLEQAQAVKPCAIVLDVQLPGMDGYQVASELRQRASLLNVPIVVVTSYAMVGDREKALASGATGYLEKPINPDTFVQQVRDHIKQSDP